MRWPLPSLSLVILPIARSALTHLANLRWDQCPIARFIPKAFISTWTAIPLEFICYHCSKYWIEQHATSHPSGAYLLLLPHGWWPQWGQACMFRRLHYLLALWEFPSMQYINGIHYDNLDLYPFEEINKYSKRLGHLCTAPNSWCSFAHFCTKMDLHIHQFPLRIYHCVKPGWPLHSPIIPQNFKIKASNFSWCFVLWFSARNWDTTKNPVCDRGGNKDREGSRAGNQGSRIGNKDRFENRESRTMELNLKFWPAFGQWNVQTKV